MYSAELLGISLHLLTFFAFLTRKNLTPYALLTRGASMRSTTTSTAAWPLCPMCNAPRADHKVKYSDLLPDEAGGAVGISVETVCPRERMFMEVGAHESYGPDVHFSEVTTRGMQFAAHGLADLVALKGDGVKRDTFRVYYVQPNAENPDTVVGWKVLVPIA